MRARGQIILLSLLGLSLCPAPLPAQTNPPPDRSSRYLVIVDTSAAMRRRAPAVQRVVENLLRSSMAAQFRPGDTVGVWTFDEQLSAGKLPLQLWTPDRAPLVASNVLGFLKTLRYEKNASNFGVVAPALDRVIQDSTRLTVLLLSDGNEKISGTPFDRQIEAAFADNYKVQEKARMPFVTVLRSVRGQIRNASVNQSPWPVEFPDWPPEAKLIATPKPQPGEPPAESKVAPRSTLPPLIVVGKKPELVATNTAPASPESPVPSPGVPAATNLPPRTTTTAPEVNPAPPPPTIAPAANQTVVPLPVVTNITAAPVALPEPPRPPPAIEPKAAETVPSPVTNPPLAAPAVSPVETQASVALPVTNPAPVAAATTNPPTPVALAVQLQPAFSMMGLIAVGVAVLLLAVALFLSLRHRARQRVERVSLITRSMDRDHK